MSRVLHLSRSLILNFTFRAMLIIMEQNFERYLQITRPLRYIDIVRPSVVRCYLAMAWILVLGLAITPPFMWIGVPPVQDISGFFVVLTKDYILAVCILMCLMIGSQIFMYSHIFCIAIAKMLQDRKFVAPVESKRKIKMWWKPAKVVLLIVGTNTITMTPVSKYI